MIRSVLVANRGEITRRVFASARKLGIETVAVYSDADANAPHVKEADRAVHLPGNTPAETYLRGDLIIAAALQAGADAIHPGYGFLSENAEFAQAVLDAGLTWIGPDPHTIKDMGSKIGAKQLMAKANVPVLEIDPENAQASDYPLLVKASAGGGGRGMRIVHEPAQLSAEILAARAEAESAFGDGTVFVEPYLQTARHIEVQVMADRAGNVVIFGDRDCSIQRRHQKVVEEAPAPSVSGPVRERLHEAARAAAHAVGYVNAGTVEFLVENAHLDDGRVYFLEMNTRLQVEHPVTECVTGVDLVELQFAIAEGKNLTMTDPQMCGHAVEVRLYAEDPADDWQPQTGIVRSFEIPRTLEPFAVAEKSGLRLDSAVESGSEVGIYYDAMLAKVIAYGPDRESALRILNDGLRRARIHGVITNIDMLRKILNDPQFVGAQIHTGLLGEKLADWVEPAASSEIKNRYAIAAALVHARHAAKSSPVLANITPAYRNMPSQPRARKYMLGHDEITVRYQNNRGTFEVVDSNERVVEINDDSISLELDGVVERFAVTVGAVVDVLGPHGAMSFVPVPTFVDPADEVAEGSLLAPMPATVVSVEVKVGDRVTKGQTIVILEAMKMQHTIAAPYDGAVVEIDVSPGKQVDSDAVLAVIENEGE